ncbi:DUF262 domain-containing protein [Motilimonas eburnea]|uniref:DUF262 domain-containing protein n=1 Tax=Motilimonas eburnea TaxID=1737488 RepID=UPI001E564A63|nr:DUF262 domain-containing protein [Motilimonas eburnea]
MRLPKPVIRFASSSTSIHALVANSGFGKEAYPWTNRFIGRFPLPSWQRELVWSQEQKISFIESVFMGYDLGSVMINDYLEMTNGTMSPMSDILIDGQQRVSAINDFITDQFPVNGLFWKDLTRIERRTFLEREMGKKMVSCFDEDKLKLVYNHLNFSGVRHSQSEMA